MNYVLTIIYLALFLANFNFLKNLLIYKSYIWNVTITNILLFEFR